MTRDILIENVRVEGGNAGFVIGGSDLADAHFTDQVVIRTSCTHDTWVAASLSTAFAVNSYIIGIAGASGTR